MVNRQMKRCPTLLIRQRNTNHSHNGKFYLIPIRMSINSKKNTQITNIGEIFENGNSALHCWGNLNRCSAVENNMEGPQESENRATIPIYEQFHNRVYTQRKQQH